MKPAARALIQFVIILSLPLGAPLNAFAAEPLWWTQMKTACRNSGGQPVSETYNDWVTGGGCVCPGSTSGSGQPTCPSGSSASGSSAGYSGGGYTSQQQLILNAASAITPVLQQVVHDWLYGNPAEEARKAQEAARIQLLQQQAIAEESRKAELAKQRILSMLKTTEESNPLAVTTDESNQLRIKIGEPANQEIGSNIALIKLGDAVNVANTGASAGAGQGFDTDGRMQGAVLPAAPSTLTPAQRKSDLLKALQAKLDQNAENKKFLDELQVTLQNSPNPDPLLISKVQEKIDSNVQDLKQLTQQIKATEQISVGVDLSEAPSKKQSP